MRRSFEPVFGSPYQVTRAFAAGLLAEMKDMAVEATRTPDAESFTMPSESLFMNRLHFGFYSLLAKLDVEVDYRAVERRLVARARGTVVGGVKRRPRPRHRFCA